MPRYIRLVDSPGLGIETGTQHLGLWPEVCEREDRRAARGGEDGRRGEWEDVVRGGLSEIGGQADTATVGGAVRAKHSKAPNAAAQGRWELVLHTLVLQQQQHWSERSTGLNSTEAQVGMERRGECKGGNGSGSGFGGAGRGMRHPQRGIYSHTVGQTGSTASRGGKGKKEVPMYSATARTVRRYFEPAPFWPQLDLGRSRVTQPDHPRTECCLESLASFFVVNDESVSRPSEILGAGLPMARFPPVPNPGWVVPFLRYW